MFQEIYVPIWLEFGLYLSGYPISRTLIKKKQLEKKIENEALWWFVVGYNKPQVDRLG